MGQLIDRQRRAAVLGQQTFADLGLRLGRVKGVVAGLAGDDQQHGDGGGDHAGLKNQAAVCRLIGCDVGQGKGDPGAEEIAHGFAHGEKHQHQGKLTGDNRDHLAAQAHARVGRAGGRAAQNGGQSRNQQQVQNHDHVRHAGEHGKAENGDEKLDDHQRRKAHQRSGQEYDL